MTPPAHATQAAVIADTHLPRGRRSLPASCVRRLRDADVILHAGDIASAATLEALRALGPPLLAVHGNVDEPALRAGLPERLEVSLAGRRIGMIHDAGPARGRLSRMQARFPACEAVVFGHSHIPLHEQREGFHIFNPGSPTDRRRQPRHTMGILHADEQGLRFEVVTLEE
jgi:uncharacterized protein